MPNDMRIGIVLNGTAPAMTLMSGAMLAFAEQEVPFDVISTTGVGGLIGLLYLAPKDKTPVEALKELPNLFVSDWLYRLFPVNFKVFSKHGPYATAFWNLRKRLPHFPVDADDPSPVKRFVNDWIQLWATALTPTSYEFSSKGFMSHVPLVEDLVDFAKLKRIKTKFYLNAFSLWTRRLRFFDEQTMSVDAYNAAQAMFVLFEPVRVQGDLLTTGATRDPTGLQAIWTHERDLSVVFALDPVGESIWREPTNAYDAFQLMLMNPIAAFQRLMLILYQKTEQTVNAAGGHLPLLRRIPVDIDEDYYPNMLKWTHANAIALHEKGYEAARPIARDLRRRGPGAYPNFDRFPRFDTENERAGQFLRLFEPIRSNLTQFLRGIEILGHGGEPPQQQAPTAPRDPDKDPPRDGEEGPGSRTHQPPDPESPDDREVPR